MNKVMTTLFLVAMVTGICIAGSVQANERMPAINEKPLVQMAILLDTSSSMSGLINQARAELWAIVNEFIFAKRNGKEPELQVALYEYGKSSLPGSEGYIRMIVPLTTDLDRISEELFALKTNGGQEYCGWVIQDATQELEWTGSPDDLKVIFIAGNEPFTQGKVDYRQACKAAVAKGIIVNTIHCGSERAGIDGKWKDGAMLADGQSLNIDQSRQAVHVAAPQDKEILELGAMLNDTYVAYGRAGNVALKRQSAQDRNASNASKGAARGRAVAKSSPHYRNESWDLVDALRTKKVKLEDVEKEDLPEQLREMSEEERRTYVEGKAKRRREIQQRIQELEKQRKKYVAEEMKKQHRKGNTLGSVMLEAIRYQARKKNYTFEPSEESSKNSDRVTSN
ncbi:MAG: VWA domain-containing protein [Phycisphaerales bacterium]|nr:MAG: VWA domain-containing protein [Phycisphaerales bacterium]